MEVLSLSSKTTKFLLLRRVSSSRRFLSDSSFRRPRHLSVDRRFFLSQNEFVSDDTDTDTDDVDTQADTMSFAKSILDDTDLRVTRKFNGRFRQNSVSLKPELC